MARSQRVNVVRETLLQQLQSGLYDPGERFMSNRSLAQRFGVSYQTASRLLDELVHQGRLERRARSGTYIPGSSQRPTTVRLIFHPRARNTGSFGAKLLEAVLDMLIRQLEVPVTVTTDEHTHPDSSSLAILWERPDAVRSCIEARYRCILLNDRPPPGTSARLIDSIATDDHGGGAMAGELLQRLTASMGPLAVLAGPIDDARSAARVAGFTSRAAATVVAAQGWYAEHGRRAAPAVLALSPTGIFVCNDRLADGLVAHCRDAGVPVPPIIGFDDAPVAETLELSTIAIPWNELATGVCRLAQQRLAGSTTASSHQVLTPHPIVRSLGFASPVWPG